MQIRVGRRLVRTRSVQALPIIAAAYGGFDVDGVIFASIEMKLRCAKFLRFEFNWRIARPRWISNRSRVEIPRRKFRRVA
jgi:hypothetical protein